MRALGNVVLLLPDATARFSRAQAARRRGWYLRRDDIIRNDVKTMGAK
jgi:hypothetical protein